MTKANVLMIDDDHELTELLGEYLTSEGFNFECCHDGVSGLKNAYRDDINLILLDVMMPGLNGFEVLKALGGRHKTPILMLTAKGDDADRVLGLELGADDYLPKPFKHQELLARMHSILRRISIIENQQPDHKDLIVNNVQLKHSTREVICHEVSLELTGTEYQLLALLMSKPSVIVSKDELSEKVLGRKLSPFDRSIDMHVSNVRKKFLNINSIDKLKTIRGAGYIFLSGEPSHD